MIVAPKIRGFICTTAHPTGCAKHVADQIALVKSRGPIANGPKKVLVVGSSTGYGLSSRIAAAFGSGAATIGVFFEKPAEEDRCGTTGWYNSAAFETEAKAAGLYARSFNGDAFSDAMKAEVIAAIKADLGKVWGFPVGAMVSVGSPGPFAFRGRDQPIAAQPHQPPLLISGFGLSFGHAVTAPLTAGLGATSTRRPSSRITTL